MAKPRPVKARPSKVLAKMTTADAYARLVGECLDHLRANEPAVIELKHPEGVHQARIAIRKLRTALALFREILKKAPVRAARRDFKEVFEVLGRCRDLDVIMVGPVAKRGGQGKLPKGFKAARKEAYDQAIAMSQSTAYVALIDRVRTALATGEWLRQGKAARRIAGQPVTEFAQARLDEQLAAVTAGEPALATMAPDERHQLRIRIKNLRYAVDFFAELFDNARAGKSRQTFMKAIKTLQEQLGILNDLAMADGVVTGLPGRAVGKKVKDANKYAARQLKRAEKAFSTLIASGRFWK